MPSPSTIFNCRGNNVYSAGAREARANLVEKMLREKTVVVRENNLLLIRKDAAEIHIDNSCAAIRDRSGTVTGVVCVFRDATERKSKDLELRWMATFPILNPNPIVEADLHGHITFLNPPALELFPALQERGASHPFLSDWTSVLRRCSQSPSGSFIREICIGKAWYLQHFFCMKNAGCIRIYGVDITQSKMAAIAREEKEDRFRKMFKNHKSAMLLIEPGTGAIIDANQSASELYGYPDDTMRTLRIYDLVDRTVGDFKAKIENAMKGKKELSIARHKTADGGVRWVEVYASMLEIKGQVLLFAIIHDISIRKQMEVDLLEKTVDLERSNKDLDAFVYSVAHDLRNPLTVIKGFCDTINRLYSGNIDGNLRHLLMHISRNTLKMNLIIESLLKLYNLSNTSMTMEVIDLGKLASSMIAELQELQPGREVQFVSRGNLVVRADSSLMTVMLSNLIRNAWKFTSKTPRAQIELFACQEKNDGASGHCFCLKDNGVGFETARAGEMFKPFKRLHSEPEFDGTGIGLAIVHRVVQRHNGRVWARGEPGRGTEIYFTLGNE